MRFGLTELETFGNWSGGERRRHRREGHQGVLGYLTFQRTEFRGVVEKKGGGEVMETQAPPNGRNTG